MPFGDYHIFGLKCKWNYDVLMILIFFGLQHGPMQIISVKSPRTWIH